MQLHDESKRAGIGWLAAFLLGLLVFTPAILRRDLWSPDEPRHAEVARTMLITGEYLVPKLSGELYPDKPAPPFWLMAVSMKLAGGPSEWAARLPFVLAAAGTLALITFIVRMLGGSAAATLLAVLMLATAYRFMWLAQRVSLDMMLTFFTALAVSGWLRQWKARGSEYVNGLIFFGASALAVLTKGPLGLLVPLLTASIHAAWTGNLRRFLAPRFLASILVFVAIVSAWVIPACIAGGEAYTRELLFKQSAGRVFNAWNHENPFWYYATKLPLEFLPWTPVLILGLVGIARGWFPAERGAVRFLLAWFLPTFIFLSIVQSKRGNYLLPLYPALAVLTALAADESALPRGAAVALRRIAGGLALLMLVIAVAVGVGQFLPQVKDLELKGLFPGAAAVAVLMGAGGALSWRFQKKSAVRAFLVQGATILGVMVFAALLVLPVIDARKSPRVVAELLAAESARPGHYVPFCGIRTEEYRFYSGLDCREVERDEFLELLKRTDFELAVLDRKSLKKVRGSLPEGTRILLETRVGRDDDVVVLRIRERPVGVAEPVSTEGPG
ncbi:MAG: glycosyltransferase family 39 protein [Planctomycetota bacterium]